MNHKKLAITGVVAAGAMIAVAMIPIVSFASTRSSDSQSQGANTGPSGQEHADVATPIPAPSRSASRTSTSKTDEASEAPETSDQGDQSDATENEDSQTSEHADSGTEHADPEDQGTENLDSSDD